METDSVVSEVARGELMPSWFGKSLKIGPMSEKRVV